MTITSFSNSCSWLLAQATASNRGWVDAFVEMEVDKLVVLLIFGSGLVAAAGYAIAGIIRAANGSPDEADDLKAQIVDLQQRVAKLEQNRI